VACTLLDAEQFVSFTDVQVYSVVHAYSEVKIKCTVRLSTVWHSTIICVLTQLFIYCTAEILLLISTTCHAKQMYICPHSTLLALLLAMAVASIMLPCYCWILDNSRIFVGFLRRGMCYVAAVWLVILSEDVLYKQ